MNQRKMKYSLKNEVDVYFAKILIYVDHYLINFLFN
jgi:hypothetical protein